MKIYWKIQQDCAGTILHVNRELMQSFGFKGARDYYASRATANVYAQRYANSLVRCGLCTENIVVVSGTFEQD